MSRNLSLIFLAIVMFFAGCNKYDDEINHLEERLDALEGSSINSIEEQMTKIQASIDALKAVDTELDAYIDALQNTVSNQQNPNADVTALQSKATELESRIAALESYVDSQADSFQDWAGATFATLELYEALQTELEGVKLNIQNINAAIADTTDAITAAYTNAIKTAITDLEDGMKEWVNDFLAESYYDMAAIDAKLQDLADEAASDEELQAAIDKQTAVLEQAKTELTAAYQDAIKAAIDENKGVIDAAIAAAITEARKELQDQINAIDAEITAINNRLNALENNFANRIQSLTYIPTHTDGKAKLAYNTTSGNWEAELSFFVTPKSIVGNIKQEDISAKGVYTAATRAANIIECDVTAFDSDTTNGTITVTVSGANLTNFLNGTSDAAVFLIISDGNSEFVSDYVLFLSNTIADDLKAVVSDALKNGQRDFTISGNLNEELQKAVSAALRDWCGRTEDDFPYNKAGQGTVSLTLPDVTEIFANTFGEIILDADDGISQVSHALKSVNLPNVTVIGDNAFRRNEYLQSVTAPKVTEVGNEAFTDCKALSDVDMPNVEKVKGYAFSYTSIADFSCSNLKEIGNCAFDHCKVTSFNLVSTTSIGLGAFFSPNLESITAPLLTVIPLWAFADCEKLTTLRFGSPITEWGGQVLNNVPTENITLYLHKDQKVLSGGDNSNSRSTWTVANGAATVEFGTGKTFCGYTFKEIKPYEE